MQLDIGFGDMVVPQPVTIEYPTILPLPAPRLRGYSRESAIAEKFSAWDQAVDAHEKRHKAAPENRVVDDLWTSHYNVIHSGATEMCCGQQVSMRQCQIVLEAIRAVVRRADHRYTVHAQGRMTQRQITDQEVQHVLLCAEAEIIEEYPTDKYSPSCLIYVVTALGRVLHVQSNHQGVIVPVRS